MTNRRLLDADLAVGVSAMPLGSLGRATREVGSSSRAALVVTSLATWMHT